MSIDEEDTIELDSLEQSDRSVFYSEQDDQWIHQQDWNDHISTERISRPFSYSPLSIDSNLEERIAEDNLELDQSISLLLPRCSCQLINPFERRPGHTVSRIDDVQKMSIMQLVSPVDTLSESFSQHQSILAVQSIHNTNIEQNQQSSALKNICFS